MTNIKGSKSFNAPSKANTKAHEGWQESLEELVEIGQLGRAHGLKGEIYVNYYADSLDWLKTELWLKSGTLGKVRKIKALGGKIHKGLVLTRFDGVNDRTAAEQMRGMTILVPANMLPESDDENIYLHDLLGLEIFLQENDQKIGTLANVEFIGEQELWVIEGIYKNEILFPAVPEFVNDINLDDGKIYISPPAGLLELYAEKDEQTQSDKKIQSDEQAPNDEQN